MSGSLREKDQKMQAIAKEKTKADLEFRAYVTEQES